MTSTGFSIRSATAALALGAALGGPATALEQDARIELGRAEYQASCAACHGAEGKGDGPVAEVLRNAPADLTALAAGAGGAFPREAVLRVIDGREMINPHGDRQMPVWGYRYHAQTAEQLRQVPFDIDVRAVVLGRITALADYLESIQSE